MSLKSIHREEIPWYPTIDEEKCIGCGECFDFCANGVFEWNEENDRPKVVNPLNCVVSCSACKNLCTQEAISFPTFQEIRVIVKKFRDESQGEISR